MHPARRAATVLVACSAVVSVACSPATLSESTGGTTGTPTSGASTPGAAQSVTVTIQPPTARVVPGDAVAFIANVFGTSDPAVSWSITEAQGTIDGEGRYRAPQALGTYHVVATSVADTTATAVATITVANAPAGNVAPIISSFTSSSSSIAAGRPVTLVWSVSGATSLSIDNGVGDVTGQSSRTVTPAAATTYTLTATGTGGTSTATASVAVTPVPPGSTTFGAEYFASPSGSGSTCSASAPCSLSGLQTKVRAAIAAGIPQHGIAATLLTGDYAGPLALTSADSGTSSALGVTWRADPAAVGSVRLLGGKNITGWSQLTSSNAPSGIWSRIHPGAKSGTSSSIWFASLPANGVTSYPSAFARTYCVGNWGSASDGCPASPSLEVYLKAPASGYTCPAGHLCPAPARMARYPNVDSDLRNVYTTSLAGRGGPSIATSDPYSFVMTNAYFGHSAAGATTSGEGGFVYNVLEELDQPGEYYVDRSSGYVYVYPLAPGDPSANGGEVLVGTSANAPLSFASGSQWITVSGLVIEASQVACVDMKGTSNTLAYSVVRNCANMAVTMSGSGHVLDHDAIHNAGNDAITCMATDASIQNNEIAEYGRLNLMYISALRVSASGVHFAHNKIHEGPWAGVYTLMPGLVAEYNDISNLPRDGSDNGVFYTFGAGNRSATIRYNYIHDIPQTQKPGSTYSTWTIYDDDEVDGVSAYGNVLYRIGRAVSSGTTTRSAFITKGANTFRNNLVVGVDVYESGTVDIEAGSPTIDHNLFISSGSNGGYGTDGSAPTPAFTCASCLPRDLSNGNGRFSSSAFTTDPNGLDYIPWSTIGIQ